MSNGLVPLEELLRRPLSKGSAAEAGQGAAAVVVRQSLGAGAREIVVPAPFEALWTLAREARKRCPGPVFALTGSSGKTTAKALLTACSALVAVAALLCLAIPDTGAHHV